MADALIDLIAYAVDSLVLGRIALEDERLIDLLNRSDQLPVRRVVLEDLLDGHVVTVDEATIWREELLLVEATGPAGNPARRTRTLAEPVHITSGPYRLVGNLRSRTGPSAIDAMQHRGFVAVTDAVVVFERHGRAQRRSVPTILVNAGTLDAILPAEDEATERRKLSEVPELTTWPGELVQSARR